MTEDEKPKEEVEDEKEEESAETLIERVVRKVTREELDQRDKRRAESRKKEEESKPKPEQSTEKPDEHSTDRRPSGDQPSGTAREREEKPKKRTASDWWFGRRS